MVTHSQVEVMRSVHCGVMNRMNSAALDAPTRSGVTPTPAPAARLENASKIYGLGDQSVRALDSVSVSIGAGQFTAVMGPSGSGKSTMMHCAAGLDRLTEGQAFIGDTELSGLSDRELTFLRRDHVGFIFQSFNLLPALTARENILLPTRLSGSKATDEAFDEIVGVLGIGERLDHRPSELSGGQQQRVAVARALVSRPAIVLADEPTGNLDSETGAEILSHMRTTVRDLGQTIAMVTHDPVAASYADRAIFVADGRVVGELSNPTTDSVLDQMREMRR